MEQVIDSAGGEGERAGGAGVGRTIFWDGMREEATGVFDWVKFLPFQAFQGLIY